jgi:osmotically-inducible protein OsmY
MKKALWVGTLAAVLAITGGMIGCATNEPAVQEAPSSDVQIAREAMNRLANDSVAGRYTFGVTVQNGVATVTGAVPDETFRLRVLGIVRGTPGVVEVVDRLYRM